MSNVLEKNMMTLKKPATVAEIVFARHQSLVVFTGRENNSGE
jgi:hypothetical protein